MLSPTVLKILSTVGDGVKKFSATVVKNCKRYRRQHKIFTAVANSAL
jgi:hypothetical protein